MELIDNPRQKTLSIQERLITPMFSSRSLLDSTSDKYQTAVELIAAHEAISNDNFIVAGSWFLYSENKLLSNKC